MNPGETFRGYDLQNHLWVVLSFATEDGGRGRDSSGVTG